MATKSYAELEREARILAEQADRLVSQFSIDLSNPERYTRGSAGFRVAADAYERIALAETKVDPAEWFRANNVDGRSAKEIMDRLWKVREELA
jgi:hypothetical protein